MPPVSVIMNIRNGAAYLREAVHSVLAQTYPDWELIVWDDRSTDGSAGIVAEFQDDRIRYFLSPEDTPLGRARNLAVRQARGEWLAFLDQDDLWMPEKLQKQKALADSEPRVGIVYGRTVIFSANGGERDFDHRHEFQRLPEGDIFERLFTDSCFFAMSSSMLRRSAFEMVGGVPDVIRVSPDYHLFLAIARRYQARAVQEVVCRYRVHASNMTRVSQDKIHQEVLWLIDRWADCLDPRLVARRRRVHNSLVAVAEMRHAATAGRGLARLLTRGSVGYVVSRPLARAFRGIRRRVRRPYWLAEGGS